MRFTDFRRISRLGRLGIDLKAAQITIFGLALALGCCGFSLEARAQAPGGLCTVPPWWWMPQSCWASWWLPAGYPKQPLPSSTRIVSGGNTFGYGPPQYGHRGTACGCAQCSHSAHMVSQAPRIARQSTTSDGLPAATEANEGPPALLEDRNGVPTSRLK